ncbi:MAG: DUF2520 domain-containing protein [Bdellovibrio sp.]
MIATNANSSDYSYLLIGSGRVAQHLSHYFHLSNLKFDTWDRSQDPHALARKIHSTTHILLAISDSALESFFRQHLEGYEKVVVHFSGAQHFEKMISAHPLMTFGPELYSLDFYKKIHFAVSGAISLENALPGLDNPYSIISAADKALYHAHCVLGGNFVTLLVNKMLTGFENLQIPKEAAHLYLEKVIENTFASNSKALTGPLARKDTDTVQKNLSALDGDPYKFIYEAFLKTLWPEYPRK